MSMKQSLFLFDYNGFRSVANPLVVALERGDPKPLQNAVAKIREETTDAKEKILDEVGIPLRAELDFSGNSKYLQSTWGRSLLIVMSKYLSPTPSLGYKWSSFVGILKYTGWSLQNQQEIIRGFPTTWLIKPEALHPYDMVVKHDMPFWYWVRPVQCTYCGWLSAEKIESLLAQLETDGDKIPGLDNIKVSPRITLQNAEIRSMFESVTNALNAAITANIGLFSVIYIAEE